jgi:hypothetical protein
VKIKTASRWSQTAHPAILLRKGTTVRLPNPELLLPLEDRNRQAPHDISLTLPKTVSRHDAMALLEAEALSRLLPPGFSLIGQIEVEDVTGDQIETIFRWRPTTPSPSLSMG